MRHDFLFDRVIRNQNFPLHLKYGQWRVQSGKISIFLQYKIHLMPENTSIDPLKKSKKSISIGVHEVLNAIEGARESGYDINRLMDKSGIDPDVLNQPEARIPLENYILLSRYTQGVMNDELSGLLARPVRLGSFWLVGLLAVHARTLGQAMERMMQYNNLTENSLKHEIRMSPGKVELIIARRANMRVLNLLAIQFVLTFTHRFAGWLTNERIILDQVKLDFAPPHYGWEFSHMFYGAPVIFRQTYNSISFDKGYLDRPIVQNESTLQSYVRRAPMDLFLPLDASGEYTRRVRNLVQSGFNTMNQPPGMEFVAARLNMNPQTLRRCLKQEGTRFQAIKAQARRDIAIHHLGNSALSIEQVAFRSGYTENSTFIRAFKGWTGFTPAQFRRGLDITV